jgi:hypothetical protein
MLSGQLSRSFPPAQRRNRHAKHVSRFANGTILSILFRIDRFTQIARLLF